MFQLYPTNFRNFFIFQISTFFYSVMCDFTHSSLFLFYFTVEEKIIQVVVVYWGFHGILCYSGWHYGLPICSISRSEYSCFVRRKDVSHFFFCVVVDWVHHFCGGTILGLIVVKVSCCCTSLLMHMLSIILVMKPIEPFGNEPQGIIRVDD